MNGRKFLSRAAAAISLLVCASFGLVFAAEQPYPNRPIRVTSVEPGGALDTVLRLIANGITGPLGQQVVIENRPSATRPEDRFVKAEPSGYNFLYYANTLWLGPFLRADIPYHPLKDFAPVSLTAKGPNIVAVAISLPVKSVLDLVALAKAKPGHLNSGVTTPGTSPSMAAVLFQSVTGARMTNVNYKGTAQAFIDLAAGRIEVMFPTILSAQSLVKAGKIRALAVTSAQPSALAPELATVASMGYPGYESVAIQAWVAPARTPPAIINRVNREISRYLAQPDAKEKIQSMGFDVVASSPEQLAATMKAEMEKMGKVLREAGIKPE